MKPDPTYLRRLYADLSDVELLEMKRGDLTEVAQKCYDEEIAQRPHLSPHADDSLEDSGGDDEFGNEDDVGSLPDGDLTGSEATNHLKPDWYEEGAEVYSTVIYAGRETANEAADARDVLKGAGIPCYLEIVHDPAAEGSAATQRWRLSVPGNLSLRATSVLETEVFNANFEEEWRGHLEHFTNAELEEMHPRVAFGGLFDRIERITRLYKQELQRRGLKSNE